MAVIVDANVALKWVIDEDGSEAARRLVAEETLAAPDLMFIECANVLCTKVRRGLISETTSRLALDAILASPIRAISARPSIGAAQVIALELRQTAYDSLYLAIAITEHATLVTADERFARAALAHPVYARSLRLLGA